ncbi:MAG: serine acetyltransferase [Eggerthellaceae bacterium]|nr:serine acetyltransferase [Eggerthellaceae bacterium]
MFNDKIDDIVEQIERNYTEADYLAFDDVARRFPNQKEVIDALKDLQRIMFPRYFGPEAPCGAGPKYFIGETLTKVEKRLHREVLESLLFRDGTSRPFADVEEETNHICSDFFYRLPDLQRLLFDDVQAAFDGDPAAQSKEEVIYSYPGFYAVFVHRIAHEFYRHNVPLIPRIMSEHAHTKTGVDINAGAQIGRFFFIDHATGVVVGETTEIGDHVKIYQGVTLGALSLRQGQALRGVKRHPTIEDNVTIYSNASVLGGETVIGHDTVIAGSTFVTESVPPYSRVTAQGVKTRVFTKPGSQTGPQFETV